MYIKKFWLLLTFFSILFSTILPFNYINNFSGGSIYQATVLLTGLEYPKGLWIKGNEIFFTETAGRLTSYGGKIRLCKYNVLTHQKAVLVHRPRNSDAVVVASDGKIYLTSWRQRIPGERGSVSVVDPKTNIETHLLDIEIASTDMFIDSKDNILIIGSSDKPDANSIYLLPAGNYMNPIVLKKGLGRTQCISMHKSYIYFSNFSAINRFDINDGSIEIFMKKFVISISFSKKYLYYASIIAHSGVIGRIDLTTKSDEILLSDLNLPIAVRYDGITGNLYFLEAGTKEGKYKDGRLSVINVEAPTKFFINAVSEYGVVSGVGWYNAGDRAVVSISTTLIIGFPYNMVFKGWVDEYGNIVSTSQRYKFVVMKSVTLIAKWEKEINVVFLLSIIFIIVVILVTIIFLLRRRKREKYPLPPPPPQSNFNFYFYFIL